MHPVYQFKLKVRLNLEGLNHEKTFDGEVTVTDALEGDPTSNEELPMVARYLIREIADKHPEIMQAESMTYHVKRLKPSKKKGS